MAVSLAVSGINSITNASLHSTALELSWTIKFEYDRAIMARHTECLSKVWTGHQEEAFLSGTVYLHFFNTGWTEPAQIELTDGDEFVTIVVYPLTGRVRIYDRPLEVPKPSREDGKQEGDE